jgi:type II restriction enzyme
MDAAYDVSDKTMLITPARFLFNAGYTPKDWNKKMLNDEHLKVLSYEANSANIFNGVDITGGVAITYHDADSVFGAIGTFTSFPSLNNIFKKVTSSAGFESIIDIVVTSFAYHYTDNFYQENPMFVGRASKGHEYDLQSNAFETYPEVFFETKPEDDDYIRILGRIGAKRCWRFIKRKYLNDVTNLDKHKVFISMSDGAAGTIGNPVPARIMGAPIIAEKGDGATITFISIGNFETAEEAINCQKYLKSKFARTLLSILKVTQHITPNKWQHVPKQDFTSSSDINWNTSVQNIDRQLYKKYNLADEEIEFIETHVKEME